MTSIDKNSDKYKIALKLINTILTNLNKDNVDDITKFVDIDREDIISELNMKSYEDLKKEIGKHYNKIKCGYYKKNSKTVIISCLRGITKELGYNLTYQQKEIYENIGTKSFRRTHTFYSIN
jgi:hypothetical protein